VASAFILLPFYIYYLSTDTFGAFSIFLAFSILVQVLTTFSYDATLYIHYHEFKDDATRLSRYVGSVLWVVAFNALILIVFFLLAGEYITELVFPGESLAFYPYGYVCLLIGVFQTIFKIHNNLLQSRQKPVIFFWSNLMLFSLIAGLTIWGLRRYPDSLAGPLGGRLVAAFVTGAWAGGRMIREFGLHFDWALLRSSLSFNFFTFIYQLQQWVMNYFDRVLLAFFLPLSTVGVYSFAVQCMLAIEFVVNGLFSSFYPKVVSTVMAQPVKAATPEVNRYYYGLTAIILLLVSGSVLVFPLLLEWFVDKGEYLASIPLIPFIGLLYIFKALRLYYSVPYGILKYTKPLPLIYLLVAGLKVAGMFLLVAPMGVYGIILSGLLSIWLEIVLLYRWGREKYAYKYNAFKLILLPVSLTVTIAIAEPLWGRSYPVAVHSLYVLVCLVLLFWVYRNEVKYLSPSKILNRS
jgi:O-antigen/teichoic acid export membrane protein